MILRQFSSQNSPKTASYALWVKVILFLLAVDLMFMGWYALESGYLNVKFGVSYQNFSEEDIITPDEAYDVQDYLEQTRFFENSKEKT